MFNIFSWQHILILVVIALIVVGPKDLPRLMHMAAKWVRKGRSMVSGLKRDFVDMTGTNELDGLRAEITAIKRKHPLSSLEAGISSDGPSRG
jgi:sec-independent protein translocase protein TatB